jgi:hypothetical protein
VTGGPIIQQYLTLETGLQRVEVGGHQGIWIAGKHAVQFTFGQPELAGNVLLWEQSGVTLRLDGRIDLASALRIARSVNS